MVLNAIYYLVIFMPLASDKDNIVFVRQSTSGLNGSAAVLNDECIELLSGSETLQHIVQDRSGLLVARIIGGQYEFA